MKKATNWKPPKRFQERRPWRDCAVDDVVEIERTGAKDDADEREAEG